jgi:hypothetical protein
MPKFKTEIEIVYNKILMLDMEDYPDEQSVRRYVELNFPEWIYDDNCEDAPDSFGYIIVSINRVNK